MQASKATYPKTASLFQSPKSNDFGLKNLSMETDFVIAAKFVACDMFAKFALNSCCHIFLLIPTPAT